VAPARFRSGLRGRTSELSWIAAAEVRRVEMAEVAETRTWITGEEFNRERRRLIAEGRYSRTSPEFIELHERMRDRDDYLWERYGTALMAAHPGHPGKWAAISPSGEVELADSEYDVLAKARERFGAGNTCIARLTPDRGAHRVGPRR
jgi:hypothetical protein